MDQASRRRLKERSKVCVFPTRLSKYFPFHSGKSVARMNGRRKSKRTDLDEPFPDRLALVNV